ncbi:MAG: molybdopterin-dependent oxidoreductase, partial [Deltaproteobacteria bacterium]|nr:molybdopterin-dependent oxidoreductase [Deltaproteobacteria bacterium]
MGIDRRQFMKLAAGFGAGFGAGAMVTPLPWQMLDDIAIWSQNWSWIPSLKGGATTFAPAVSKTCPSSAAVRIRLVGGRPVRVLPNTEHPLGGGVTALAAAELQLLNSPARVAHPLKRNADGSFSRLDWSEAAQLLCEKLAEAGEEAAFISGDENGSVNEVISSFAAALGSKQVFLMPSEGQCAARACDLLGLNAQLGYDLERSDYVLSIGANLLETWGTVVRNRRLFGASHPHPQEGVSSRASLVYAGPLQNNTAAVADSWLPIPPGFEIVLALGLAHLLISRGRTIPAADFGPFAQMTADYDLDSVAQATGLAVETLTNLADKLLAAKAPVVILGGEFNQGAGAAAVMAGFAVNALLGKINAPGGLRLLPKYGPVLAGARSRSALYGQSDLAAWMGGEKKGPRPAALVIHEANPAFALPDPAAAAAFLKETPVKAAFSCFL